MNEITPDRPLDILILAAGLGTRMKSGRAKVLHKLGGRSLIAHVSRSAALLNPRRIYVVVGHQAEEVKTSVSNELGDDEASFVNQAKQLGTGDAVNASRKDLAEANSNVLILSGDVPLVRAETLRELLRKHREANAACTILSIRLENPTGYG